MIRNVNRVYFTTCFVVKYMYRKPLSAHELGHLVHLRIQWLFSGICWNILLRGYRCQVMMTRIDTTVKIGAKFTCTKGNSIPMLKWTLMTFSISLIIAALIWWINQTCFDFEGGRWSLQEPTWHSQVKWPLSHCWFSTGVLSINYSLTSDDLFYCQDYWLQ